MFIALSLSLLIQREWTDIMLQQEPHDADMEFSEDQIWKQGNAFYHMLDDLSQVSQ